MLVDRLKPPQRVEDLRRRKIVNLVSPARLTVRVAATPAAAAVGRTLWHMDALPGHGKTESLFSGMGLCAVCSTWSSTCQS